MSTLYRSPNIRIDAAEFHIAVTIHGKRGTPAISYRFRFDDREMWRSVADYPGPLPKGMERTLRTFRTHAELAMRGAA